MMLTTSFITAYWEGYSEQSIDPYPLNKIPEYVNFIPIAFVKPVYNPSLHTNKSHGNITKPLCNDWAFDDELDPDPFVYKTNQIKQWVDDINNRGTDQKVLLSLNDTSYTLWYPDVDIQLFSKNVAKSVDEWGLGGVDIDAESLMSSDKYCETFIKLIKCLRSELSPNKIISYTCYTQSEYDTNILAECKDDIDFLNTMAYWNDIQGQIELFQHYAKCIGDANKIGIGCKAGKDGDYTSIDTVRKVAIWLKQNGYKRMMLWSLTRDIEQITNLENNTYLNTMYANLQNAENDTDWVLVKKTDDRKCNVSNPYYHRTSCVIL